MSNSDEKNIHVTHGIPPGPPSIGSHRDWPWSWSFGPGSHYDWVDTQRIYDDIAVAEYQMYIEAWLAEAEARAQAQLQAEADAREQAQAAAEIHAQAIAEAIAKAEANAIAERERTIVAYQHALESLPHAHAATKIELDRKHIDSVSTLATTLAADIQLTDLNSLTGQPLLNAILEKKTRINYLISQKSETAVNKHQSAYLFAGIDPLGITEEQYRAILGSKSVNAEQAHQVHRRWEQAYSDALEANLHTDAARQLSETSSALSDRYAQQAWDFQNSNLAIHGENETLLLKHAAQSNRLWSVVAGPTVPTQSFPTATDAARAVAEKLFTRQVSRILGRALPHLALLYPTELANGEHGNAILTTPASKIGVSRDVDLSFIATQNGTIDVTHRLSLEEFQGEVKTVWTKTDGVTVGEKVRVRSFVYNPDTQSYEFTRDGETAPSLVWTPAVTPESSSTLLPVQMPERPAYTGVAVATVASELGEYPTYDVEDLEDYILIFPDDSGLGPVYLVFNQRIGDHRYHSKPNQLPAFPDAKQVRGKTRVQGGGQVRPRWTDTSGHIYEWDFRHGTVEKYNKRGIHLGEFDHETGVQTKNADPSRRIEP